MGYLVLGILSSTCIFLVFRWFSTFGVKNLYAIAVNYIIAGLLGYLLSPQKLSAPVLIDTVWFWPAIGIGFLFIALFQLMAATAQNFGVSRVSIAVKMSVVLPVLAGFWLYHERLSVLSIAGVVLALAAVYFGTKKVEANANNQPVGWRAMLPIVLFLGSGLVDVLMKYAQQNWLGSSEMAIFTGFLFFAAFVWGVLFVIIKIWHTHIWPSGRDLIGGVVLGIPNFGSIYFLLLALQHSGWPSAAIYPINNVAIVALSAIFGVLLFGEKLLRVNILGLILAIAAIALIAYG